MKALRGGYDGRFFAWLLGKIGSIFFFTGRCVYCGDDCPMDNIHCWRCDPYRGEEL